MKRQTRTIRAMRPVVKRTARAASIQFANESFEAPTKSELCKSQTTTTYRKSLYAYLRTD